MQSSHESERRATLHARTIARLRQLSRGCMRFSSDDDGHANCDHAIARKRRISPSSFRTSSQANQESLPRVGDEQEIEEGHSKEAGRFHTPYLQNRAQLGKAIEEQLVSEFLMAHGFHGGQERFHFLLRHRPRSAFPRHGNPRTPERGAHLNATSGVETTELPNAVDS